MERFGRYELVRRIGVGGMAEIFLARSSSLDGFEKDVVIKRVRAELSIDDKFSSMFIEEGRVSISLSHPNIVQVFDFGEHQGAYYLAMEYIDGCNLLQLGSLDGIEGVGLPPQLALLIISEVLKALDYAHNKRGRNGEMLNIIHRDVSPHNVLVSFDGAVKLGDFGIAKMRGRVSQTSPGIVLGKVAYMAPEHLRGEAIDCRTDLFSCGVVLWELLVGSSLYAADVKAGVFDRILDAEIDPPSRRNRRLSPAIDTLVMGALAKEPAMRYASARDFGNEVHAYLVRNYPEANLYDVQSFLSSHQLALTANPTKGSLETPVSRNDGIHRAPAVERAIQSLSTTKLPRAEPAKGWSKAVLKLLESFKRRPSLWVLLKLAEQCVSENDRESAMATYRIAAVKFAQRGLSAQALFCCHHVLALATEVEASTITPSLSLLPSLAGHTDREVMPALSSVMGPMGDLLRDLLASTESNTHDVGLPTPILAQLDGTGFVELAATAPLQSFAEGAAIVKQGDVGRNMFFLARGRVLVYATQPEGQRIYLSSLTAGDFFGENGFFTGAPRSATVEAIYPSDVIEIDRALYNRVTAGHSAASGILLQFYKERIVETVLAKSPVFGLLDNERRRAVADRFTPRVFGNGELVVKEGARSDQIYLVKDGEGDVFSEPGGKRIDLSRVGPGTLFGEVAALRGIPRTASVQARGKLEVLELSGRDFEALLDAEPGLKRRVLEEVSLRVRNNIDKLMGGSVLGS